MKFPRSMLPRNRGSALITVVFLIAVMSLLTGSLLLYTRNERRANERNRLMLRARNMSENISAYAAEQITTKLYRLRSFAPIAYMTGVNEVHRPPNHVLDSQYTSHDVGMEVRAGLTGSTGYTFIDPATNPNSPNAGLQVNTSTIPIIAKATASHSSIGSLSAYTQYDLEADMVPLFQFAVFYNMDMEFGPGADMIIAGPIHTNGNLIARSQTGFDNTIQFLDRVSAAGGFFANTAHKGPTYNEKGTADNGPGGNGPLKFQNPAGTVETIQDGSLWRDHKYGKSSVSTSTLADFRTFASKKYGVNFRTSVHGVTPLVLPGVADYSEKDDPDTTEDERDNGRQIIEPAGSLDTAQLKETKFARRAGLYIIVNPDDQERNGVLPDSTVVPMRARSYRAWLNTVNADLSHTLHEVILPGQPSYGPLNANINNLPNRYRTNSSVRHNQVLRIPQGGGVDLADTGYTLGATAMTGFADAYFFDLRRAANNRGAPYDRATYPYTPRPITKIDFDMTRFRMAVERTLLNASTSTIYYPSRPVDSDTWGDFIFNSAASPGSYGLGLDSGFTSFPSQEILPVIQQSQLGQYSPTTLVLGARQQTGNAANQTTDYAGRFVIEETTDSTGVNGYVTRYTSAANEGSLIYTPTPGQKFVRVRLYLNDAAPHSDRLCDEEIIPIVDDTSSTVTAVLTNDYLVVPTASSGTIVPWAFDNAENQMRVYIGGIDDTANWRFDISSATNGATVTWDSDPLKANHFRVDDMDSGFNSATLTVRARKGAMSVTKVMTLVKQSSVTGLKNPAQHSRWITTKTDLSGDPFRIYFAPADPNNALIKTNPSTFAVTASDLVNTSGASPWFDGITVYVHSVDAELRGDGADADTDPDRIDSAVRLWNGRGPVISLAKATYPGRTGLAFATNDAAYIIGHFNADGTVNTDKNSKTNPGGFSARYPESSSEMLTSLMADAITIVSQPSFTQNGSNYYQTRGWSDSLSAHRKSTAGNYSDSWKTSNPSSGNTQDGEDYSLVPAAMPNLGSLVPGTGSARTAKFEPINTEVSLALLTGIVPTNHNPTGLTDGKPSPGANNQTSGGVHNFPRLLEHWDDNDLYIRGSMVGMFESRVAMEPWSLRVYSAPGRFWGLHESLRDVKHDLPLEPILLNARRVRYRELTATEYAKTKAEIEALPH